MIEKALTSKYSVRVNSNIQESQNIQFKALLQNISKYWSNTFFENPKKKHLILWSKYIKSLVYSFWKTKSS